jgi:hypothetical protein
MSKKEKTRLMGKDRLHGIALRRNLNDYFLDCQRGIFFCHQDLNLVGVFFNWEALSLHYMSSLPLHYMSVGLLANVLQLY